MKNLQCRASENVEVSAYSEASFTKNALFCSGSDDAPSERMPKTADEINEITQKIIGCAIEVHRTLGPGLLESVYRECLAFELHRCGLHFEENCKLPISYKGHLLKTTLVLDLLVEQSVVVELKAVESLHPIHSAQVLTYLRLSGCPAGLLLNFNTTSIRTGLRRLTHPDLYTKKRSD